MVVFLSIIFLATVVFLFYKQTFFQKYKNVMFLQKSFFVPSSWSVTEQGFSHGSWYCLIFQGTLEDTLSSHTLDSCIIETTPYRHTLSKGNLEDLRKHFFFIEALGLIFVSISPVLEGGIEDYFLDKVVIKFLEDYKI